MSAVITKDVNDLLDDLFASPELQERWQTDPEGIMAGYSLTPAYREALLNGDSDALLAIGLAERHTRMMRLAW